MQEIAVLGSILAIFTMSVWVLEGAGPRPCAGIDGPISAVAVPLPRTSLRCIVTRGGNGWRWRGSNAPFHSRTEMPQSRLQSTIWMAPALGSTAVLGSHHLNGPSPHPTLHRRVETRRNEFLNASSGRHKVRSNRRFVSDAKSALRAIFCAPQPGR